MTIEQGAAIALSIAGGVIAWLGGRRILRHIDDPLFADRLFAHRMAMVRIYTVMVLAIAWLARPYALLALALLFLSIAVGGFSTRKQLYDETWTLPQYLLNRARMVVFAGGLWIGILCAPAIVERVGIGGGGLVLALLILGFFFHQDLLLFGLDSEPLRDTALLERFEPILAKSEAPRPRFFEGGPRTGRFTNAIALPRGRRSRIVFTRALLRDLDANEVTAIFAHELAHIEHYAKKRSRIRTILGAFVLPLLAVVPQVVVLMNDPKTAVWVVVGWPILFLFAMTAALVGRQKHEGEADLRALQLGADPLALISGLEKLHQRNRMPRRYDAKREQRMTHPSVARRVAAIRRAAGLVQETPPTLPREFGDIRFTDDEVNIRGVAYRYDALQSLALRKTLRGFALVGRSGRKIFRAPIDAAAAVEINPILDWCDGRLAPQSTAQQQAPREARLIAVLVLLISMFPGISFPPIILAFVALIAPNATSIAALGATAIAAGIAALFHVPMPFIGTTVRVFAAAEILIGLIALLMLRRVAKAKQAKAPLITLYILFGLALLPIAIAFRPEQPGLQLYRIASGSPSIAVLLIGMAAALAVSGRKRVSIAVTAAALAFVGCGTRAFARVSGSDPLLTDKQPQWVSAPAQSRTDLRPKRASSEDEDEDLPPPARIHAVPAMPPLARYAPMAMMFTLGNGPTEFWSKSHCIGRTVFTAYDVAPIPESERFAVVGYDASTTYIGTIDDTAIRAAGSLRGRASRIATGSRARIALTDNEGQLVVWNLRSGKAMRIPCMAMNAAFVDRGITVSCGGDVAFYSTDTIE